MKQALRLLLLPILSSLLSLQAFSQTVEKVQGKAAIINGGEIQLNMGDELYTIDDQGKKTGWIKVQQLKNNRAVTAILKGTVTPGESLIKKPASPTGARASRSSDNPSSPETRTQKFKSAMGFFLGYSMDSISFPATNVGTTYSENVSMTGSNFVLKGFYDHPLTNSFNFRFLGGLDGYNGSYSAKNTSINKDGSSTSNLALSTLAFDGEIEWYLYHSGLTNVWIGGGYSFQYAMSVTTNLVSLQTSSSYSNSIFVGTGANIKMGHSSFLPIFVHYSSFIAGSGITQTAISVGAGWGWAY